MLRHLLLLLPLLLLLLPLLLLLLLLPLLLLLAAETATWYRYVRHPCYCSCCFCCFSVPKTLTYYRGKRPQFYPLSDRQAANLFSDH